MEGLMQSGRQPPAGSTAIQAGPDDACQRIRLRTADSGHEMGVKLLRIEAGPDMFILRLTEATLTNSYSCQAGASGRAFTNWTGCFQQLGQAYSGDCRSGQTGGLAGCGMCQPSMCVHCT